MLLVGLTAVCSTSISSRVLESACAGATKQVEASIIKIRAVAMVGEPLGMVETLVGHS